MSVYCLFRGDSDGYTYWCDILIGVFSSEDEAETGLLFYIDIQEKRKAVRDYLGYSTDPDDYSIQECELNELIMDEIDTTGLDMV